MAKLGPPKNKQRYFEFLVDSGSDFTIISKSDAAYLGINYQDIKEPEVGVEVANLAIIKTKKTSMILTIKNINLLIPILVANQEVECLLGRKGIFDRFNIIFQESKQQVIFMKI